MHSLDDQIDSFLKAPAIAVVGASDEKHKYGHKVYVCYLQNNRKIYPVNPNAETVMGDKAYPSLSALPEQVESSYPTGCAQFVDATWSRERASSQQSQASGHQRNLRRTLRSGRARLSRIVGFKCQELCDRVLSADFCDQC